MSEIDTRTDAIALQRYWIPKCGGVEPHGAGRLYLREDVDAAIAGIAAERDAAASAQMEAVGNWTRAELRRVDAERERDALRAEVERLRATPPEVAALVEASTALRDHIARWHDGGPVAGPEESRALFEALDDALAKWEAAQ